MDPAKAGDSAGRAVSGMQAGRGDAYGQQPAVETHPLEPFLPDGARILFLGSFPPPRERWSMEFFYPNFTNDFWRIQGLIHFGDPKHFEEQPGDGAKAVRFDRGRIIAFCREKGLAFYDTARKVCRLKGNASDAFLEILESADLPGMLAQLPQCRTLVTTGGKASEELLSILEPKLIKLKLYAALLDSAAAEHAARTVAMQTATDNGENLLSELTLQYNKGRQQKITAEILDLAGGQTQE